MSRNLSPEQIEVIGDLLCELSALGKCIAVRGKEHKASDQIWTRFDALCKQALAFPTLADGELTVACRGERLYLEHMPLPENCQQLSLITPRMPSRGAGFVLSLNLSKPDVFKVLLHLGFGPREQKGDDYVEPMGFRWLAAGELERREAMGTRHATREHAVLRIPSIEVDTRTYDAAFHELALFLEQCAGDQLPDLRAINEVAYALADQVATAPESIVPLTTIPYYDEFTHFHSVNVTVLTVAAAALATNNREHLRRTAAAALLHDVGKATIPVDVLYKTGRLDDTEMEIVRAHSMLGARLLQRFDNTDPLAVAACMGHHLRDNGAGYPMVSSDYRLGAVVSLMGVVDVFEALTAVRPYKRPLTTPQAFEVLYTMPNMASRTTYIDLLLHALGFHPVGCRVRTLNDQVGIVCSIHTQDPRRCDIELLEKKGRFLEPAGVQKGCITVGVGGPAIDESQRLVPVVAIDPEFNIEINEPVQLEKAEEETPPEEVLES